MAQEDGKVDESLNADEAQEVEKLLENSEEEQAGGEGWFSRLLGNKKLLIIIGGGALVLIVLLGGGLFFMLSDNKPGEEEVVEQAPPEPIIPKVNIYQLKPFFLLLKLNEEETGKFLSVTPNLLLSNQALNREIDKILPLVRKNIYAILRRKDPRKYTDKKRNIKETIKREIIIASNSLLLSGTGTIQDVLFTQFVVK